jgi:hypothetical protein
MGKASDGEKPEPQITDELVTIGDAAEYFVKTGKLGNKCDFTKYFEALGSPGLPRTLSEWSYFVPAALLFKKYRDANLQNHPNDLLAERCAGTHEFMRTAEWEQEQTKKRNGFRLPKAISKKLAECLKIQEKQGPNVPVTETGIRIDSRVWRSTEVSRVLLKMARRNVPGDEGMCIADYVWLLRESLRECKPRGNVRSTHAKEFAANRLYRDFLWLTDGSECVKKGRPKKKTAYKGHFADFCTTAFRLVNVGVSKRTIVQCRRLFRASALG